MLAAGRLADCQLVGYEARADAVLDQVTVLLRREMRLRVAQPLEDLQPLVAGKRLEQIGIEHA